MGLRRASLRTALRSGDELEAARAGSRLRLRSGGFTAAELAEARAARARLGRALREARWRKWLGGPAAVQREARSQTSLPRAFPVQAVSNAVVGLATVIALAALILFPQVRPPEAAAPAAAPELVATAHVVEARLGGRGRTTVAVALVAEPTPSPPAEPTASPVPSPSAAPTVAPRRSAAPVAAVATPGGVPGGQPGGVPGGQPGGTGSATPIPTPNRAPLFSTPAPTGWDRITLVVTNGINGEPLQDVCIVLGTGDCSLSRPHTNALGIWYMDLPGDAAVQWEVKFKLKCFTPESRLLTYRPGQDLTVPVKLYQVC